MDIICITVAPAFIAAGIFLTLNPLSVSLQPCFRRLISFQRHPSGEKIRALCPQWYTRIFIACSLVSILVQTVGSCLSINSKLTEASNTIRLTGIAFQVLTLLMFGFLAIEPYVNYSKQNSHSFYFIITHINRTLMKSMIAIAGAYTAILIRSVYHVVEMAARLRNRIMRNEASFIMLDSLMRVVACVVLVIWHPWVIFIGAKTGLRVEDGAEGGNESMVEAENGNGVTPMLMDERVIMGEAGSQNAIAEETRNKDPPMSMEGRNIVSGAKSGNVSASGTRSGGPPTMLMQEEVVPGGRERV
ncbi:hypothetical protein BDZ45DRAFT_728743 [Acephala macrosclerotiorum]|nr:hypothetical protein BDZ45DRAFT_728743 [Acephala macrosclerotiorum]